MLEDAELWGEESSRPVKVRLLGGYSIVCGGERINLYENPRVAQVLAFSAFRHDTPLSIDDVVTAFYGDELKLSADQASDKKKYRARIDQLKAYVNKNKARFSTLLPYLMLENRKPLSFQPGTIVTDIDLFHALLNTARSGSRSQCKAASEKLFHLYAELLPDDESSWVRPEREKLLDDYLTLHRMLALELAFRDLFEARCKALEQRLRTNSKDRDADIKLTKLLFAARQWSDATPRIHSLCEIQSDQLTIDQYNSIQALRETYEKAVAADRANRGQRLLIASNTPVEHKIDLFIPRPELSRLKAFLTAPGRRNMTASSRKGQNRLGVLQGVSGSGRKRLLMEALGDREVQQFMEGTVIVLSLLNIDTADQMGYAIAHEMEWTLPLKQHPLDFVIAEFSQTQQNHVSPADGILIVLVDVGYVTHEVEAVVSKLLDGVPRLRCLLISLSAPRLSCYHMDVGPLDRERAIALFRLRTDEQNPPCSAESMTEDIIAALCERVGWLPRGIEILARRCRTLSPKQILASPKSPVAELDADFAMILEGLTPPLAAIWSALSVFRGGWPLEAAHAVCEDLGNVEEALRELTDNSAIYLRETNGAVRYHMLEPARDFAQRQLDAPTLTEYCRRHFQYYAGWLEQEVRTGHGNTFEGVAQRRDELPNINAALEWCQSRTDHNPEGLQFADYMIQFWHSQGYLNEVRYWLSLFLDRTSGSPKSRFIAMAYNGLAVRNSKLGNYKDAEQMARVSVEMYVSLEILRGQASAMLTLGNSLYYQGKLLDALATGRKAVSIAQDLVDDYDLGLHAFALLNSGNAANELGMMQDARQFYKDVFEVLSNQSQRFPAFEGLAYNNLGYVDVTEYRYDEAWANLEQSITLLEEAGAVIDQSLPWTNKGRIHYAKQEYELARGCFEKGLKIRRKYEDAWGETHSLNLIALVELKTGKHEACLSCLKNALILCRQTNDDVSTAIVMTSLTRLMGLRRLYGVAAWLWGASDVLRTRSRMRQETLPEVDISKLQSFREQVEQVLGPETFGRHYENGKKAARGSWDELITVALRILEPVSQKA